MTVFGCPNLVIGHSWWKTRPAPPVVVEPRQAAEVALRNPEIETAGAALRNPGWATGGRWQEPGLGYWGLLSGTRSGPSEVALGSRGGRLGSSSACQVKPTRQTYRWEALHISSGTRQLSSAHCAAELSGGSTGTHADYDGGEL